MTYIDANATKCLMDQDTFEQLMQGHQVAVVHFSGTHKNDRGTVFPEDLRNVIENGASWNLSSHALIPGTQMSCWGDVGLLLKPLAEHVISVSHIDSGSFQISDQEDGSAGKPLTAESLIDSLNHLPGGYNEWRIRNAKIAGIYVRDPNFIQVTQKVLLNLPYQPEPIIDIEPQHVSLEYVRASFYEYRLYTMGPTGLMEI